MKNDRIGKLIESALEDYGGVVTRNAVLWHLKHTYDLEQSDAIAQPEKFIQALKDIYGDFEKIIEENICEKIAREYGIDGNGLVELAEKINEVQAD